MRKPNKRRQEHSEWLLGCAIEIAELTKKIRRRRKRLSPETNETLKSAGDKMMQELTRNAMSSHK